MKKNLLTLAEIEEKTIWVAKMQGWRTSGTRKEIGHLFYEEDCRDYDIACEQPEELKDFYDRYWAYVEANSGFITIPEFYKDIYLVDVQAEEKPKRIWTEEEIKVLVQTNDKVLYGALKNLYNCQTADEQDGEETTHRNGAGFNSVDAPILSSFAQFLTKNGFLTDKQKVLARKKLVKYNRQLTNLANA